MKRASAGTKAPRRSFGSKKGPTISPEELQRLEEGLKAIQAKHRPGILALTGQVSALLKDIAAIDDQMDDEARLLNPNYSHVVKNFTLSFSGMSADGEEEDEDGISLAACCSFIEDMHINANAKSEAPETPKTPPPSAEDI